MTDDGDFVLAELRRHRRIAPWRRLLLAIASAAQLVLSVSWLAGLAMPLDLAVANDHLARDGALGVVFGVVGLAVATRPQFAWFSIPVLLVGLLVQSVFVVLDVRGDEVPHGFEWLHVLGAVIAVTVTSFTQPVGRRAERDRHLRAVEKQ